MLKRWFLAFAALIFLDSIWFHFVAGELFLEWLRPIARADESGWRPDEIGFVGAYLFLALGIEKFVVVPSLTLRQAFTNGALFGLCVYGVYDFTNLAILRIWPLRMVWTDIFWGCFSVSLVSGFIHLLKSRTNARGEP